LSGLLLEDYLLVHKCSWI